MLLGLSRNLRIEVLALLMGAFTLCALTSCAHVPDVLICTEISMSRGWCTKTISDEEFYVDDAHPYAFDGKNKQTWWDARNLMIHVPVFSWVDIKTYIIQRCKTDPSGCNSAVASWDRKIKDIDDAVAK